MTPPPEVLDLFAVPDDVVALPGGRGDSVRAGDLVLSPGRDAAVAAWLSPLLARLAVALDEEPGRCERDLRIAVPVPARDGSWVVAGWGATRYEPGTVACHDLDVTLAAGRVLHARLAVALRSRPPGLDQRDDRWARAERLVFGPPEALSPAAGTAAATVIAALVPLLDPAADLGPEQLVHADLAGNVLLDARGAPVVIDVSPAWRPVRWAEAVCVLDAVQRGDAAREVLGRFNAEDAQRQALLRAIAWRALSDPPGAAPYDELLGRLASR